MKQAKADLHDASSTAPPLPAVGVAEDPGPATVVHQEDCDPRVVPVVGFERVVEPSPVVFLGVGHQLPDRDRRALLIGEDELRCQYSPLYGLASDGPCLLGVEVTVTECDGSPGILDPLLANGSGLRFERATTFVDSVLDSSAVCLADLGSGGEREEWAAFVPYPPRDRPPFERRWAVRTRREVQTRCLVHGEIEREAFEERAALADLVPDKAFQDERPSERRLEVLRVQAGFDDEVEPLTAQAAEFLVAVVDVAR